MKKLTIIIALMALGTTVSVAQSNETSKQTRSGTTVERSNDAAQMQRLENMQRLEGTVTTEKTPVQNVPTQEQLDASIAELEKHIHENDGKEGFDKAAYQRRLDYLHKKKAESTPR
jgi:hypothetical protein